MEEEEEKAKKKKSIVMHSKTAATFLPLFPLFSLFPLSLFSLFSLFLWSLRCTFLAAQRSLHLLRVVCLRRKKKEAYAHTKRNIKSARRDDLFVKAMKRGRGTLEDAENNDDEERYEDEETISSALEKEVRRQQNHGPSEKAPVWKYPDPLEEDDARSVSSSAWDVEKDSKEELWLDVPKI